MSPETLGKIYELLNNFLPIACVMGIFYVMVVLPQRKKTLLQQNFLGNLKKGDQIITNSGIFGVVEVVADHEVRLNIANGVTISIEKGHIARLQQGASNTSRKQSPGLSEKSSPKQGRKEQIHSEKSEKAPPSDHNSADQSKESLNE